MDPHKKSQTQTALVPPNLVEVVAALPPDLRALVNALPQRLMDVLAGAPTFSDRKGGAPLVTQYVIPVSPRSMEVWPLPWQHANGKAVTPTIAMFAVAYSKLSSAPVVMGGRRSRDAHVVAVA